MTPPNAGAPALVTVASPTDRTELAMPTTQTPTQTSGTSIRVAFAFDHAGGGVLSPATCLWLLGNEQLGRVAFRADGEVLVLPVNYVMDGEAVAFRTAVGSKLTAAIEEDAVGFEVDGRDPASRSGWSVLINGKAVSVTDPGTLARLEQTGLKPWADRIEHPHWVRILPESMTGRAVIHS